MAGGDTFAADDVGGAKYMRVKSVWGADGSVNDTSAAAPMPINVTTLPTLTKGTQGSTGLSVQSLKDGGRVIVNCASALSGTACVTSEALIAFNISRDGAATASATSMTVTAAKRWRIQAITVGLISTSAAVLSARFCLRMEPNGGVTGSSPIIALLPVASAPATAQQGGQMFLQIPDGLEFSGTQQIALTQLCSVTTGLVYASIVGYEY